MDKTPDSDGEGGGGGGGDGFEPLPYKTWILRVYIHCGGCEKKVKKVLQSIEGVYKIEIDSKQHKVVVTGNVESGPLIKKLNKSGKNAELWTGKDEDIFAGVAPTKDNGGGGFESSGEDHLEEKGGAPAPAALASGAGGGGGKKKKKKKKKKGNAGPTNAGGAPPPPAASEPSPGWETFDQMNVEPPRQHAFTYPQFYYPTPEYGMSYNTAPPMAASYYTLPIYSYTPPPSDLIMNEHHGDDEMDCSIM